MGVVVVGAGIAGVACARVLAGAGVPVRVLERGRVVGGRMATKRYGGRPADIGAGYFTARDGAFGAVVASWCDRGLARPWTDTLLAVDGSGRAPTTGPVRYAAAGGLRSLVADLAEGLEVVTEHPVTTVDTGLVDGERVDAVALAVPGPQAARLLPAGSPARHAAAHQSWSPALVATLRHPARTWPAFHGAFVNDHPTLAAVFDDGSRRGDDAPVLVAHTTAEFAARHLESPAAATAEIADAVGALFDLPAPTEAHVHRWTHATPNTPADAPFLLADGIGIAGDAWGRPRVETAWLSGTALGKAIVDGL
ncbi:Amine oxidase, flavin-containing [Actinokineospora spheciospongiae]|uniref:Amine oxidase, flavin-containing n=1 Tax=Actinokineospora spheciospongiae TaxID=909613 RepID=W7J5J8_9PSEU|nr:FAD-dependent oxidoreductase [Actinokineospora spheciospongiae]EWC64261.1 Amine oxidase, flavin-containing [Actinokineospora spheciospongiae]PWW54839.1 hypothetical protein DFQ13_11333 [Actinokineospora spheciospongiae]